MDAFELPLQDGCAAVPVPIRIVVGVSRGPPADHDDDVGRGRAEQIDSDGVLCGVRLISDQTGGACEWIGARVHFGNRVAGVTVYSVQDTKQAHQAGEVSSVIPSCLCFYYRLRARTLPAAYINRAAH